MRVECSQSGIVVQRVMLSLMHRITSHKHFLLTPCLCASWSHFLHTVALFILGKWTKVGEFPDALCGTLKLDRQCPNHLKYPATIMIH